MTEARYTDEPVIVLRGEIDALLSKHAPELTNPLEFLSGLYADINRILQMEEHGFCSVTLYLIGDRIDQIQPPIEDHNELLSGISVAVTKCRAFYPVRREG